jgi:putative SOS response-associated peptidase YedK
MALTHCMGAICTPLALAGLWEGYRNEDGSVLRSFAVITTDVTPDLAWLHDRMPVIIENQDWPVWLGETEDDPARLLHPACEGALRVWPVGERVSRPDQNGPDLLTPLKA